MTAAALLHPDASSSAVQAFRDVSPNIQVLENLEEASRESHQGKQFSSALIFGGDGTVHRHLQKLYKLKIPALIVPKGSGNDFAKALGIANDKIALSAWKRFCSHGDNVKEIDLGVIRPVGTSGAVVPDNVSSITAPATSETLFCCVTGIGLDAEANRRANAMPKWLRGSAGYVLAGLQAMMRFAPTEITVRANPNPSFSTPSSSSPRFSSPRFSNQASEPLIQKPGMFVAIGNAGRYGGGARVAPRAKLDDGLLDVCFVGELGRIGVVVRFPTIFFGAHTSLKVVEYFQSSGVRIESGRPLEVYADGEAICQTPVEISVLPRALKVIVLA
jgi:diacylglycerol kinase (ATP)